MNVSGIVIKPSNNANEKWTINNDTSNIEMKNNANEINEYVVGLDNLNLVTFKFTIGDNEIAKLNPVNVYKINPATTSSSSPALIVNQGKTTDKIAPNNSIAVKIVNKLLILETYSVNSTPLFNKHPSELNANDTVTNTAAGKYVPMETKFRGFINK